MKNTFLIYSILFFFLPLSFSKINSVCYNEVNNWISKDASLGINRTLYINDICKDVEYTKNDYILNNCLAESWSLARTLEASQVLSEVEKYKFVQQMCTGINYYRSEVVSCFLYAQKNISNDIMTSAKYCNSLGLPGMASPDLDPVKNRGKSSVKPLDLSSNMKPNRFDLCENDISQWFYNNSYSGSHSVIADKFCKNIVNLNATKSCLNITKDWLWIEELMLGDELKLNDKQRMIVYTDSCLGIQHMPINPGGNSCLDYAYRYGGYSKIDRDFIRVTSSGLDFKGFDRFRAASKYCNRVEFPPLGHGYYEKSAKRKRSSSNASLEMLRYTVLDITKDFGKKLKKRLIKGILNREND